MSDLKKDFPIFENNKDLIYLDSTATSQKPNYVIEGITEYLKHTNSNIHRGLYDIAIESEKIYFDSKKKIAEYIGAESFKEIIYTYNSNYAANIITQTLRTNNALKKGDKVLVSIVEHHANIVPWLILKKEIGIELEYINIDENYNLDFDDLEKKYTKNVKVIALTHISNLSGHIFDLEKVGKMKRDDTLFMVDVSQSIQHFKIDVKKINCDYLFFTGHKIMADTGIGVFWGKQELLNKYDSIFSGGGAINEVKRQTYKQGTLPFKYEPGTPNISGALSLLKAFEYIEKIGGYAKIYEIENELINHSIEGFRKREKIKLIGLANNENRIGVFGFYIEGVHSNDIADTMAENNICIRSGQHCAEPFIESLGLENSARMSLYIYNTKEDIDSFFKVLDDNFL